MGMGEEKKGPAPPERVQQLQKLLTCKKKGKGSKNGVVGLKYDVVFAQECWMDEGKRSTLKKLGGEKVSSMLDLRRLKHHNPPCTTTLSQLQVVTNAGYGGEGNPKDRHDTVGLVWNKESVKLKSAVWGPDAGNAKTALKKAGIRDHKDLDILNKRILRVLTDYNKVDNVIAAVDAPFSHDFTDEELQNFTLSPDPGARPQLCYIQQGKEFKLFDVQAKEQSTLNHEVLTGKVMCNAQTMEEEERIHALCTQLLNDLQSKPTDSAQQATPKAEGETAEKEKEGVEVEKGEAEAFPFAEELKALVEKLEEEVRELFMRAHFKTPPHSDDEGEGETAEGSTEPGGQTAEATKSEETPKENGTAEGK